MKSKYNVLKSMVTALSFWLTLFYGVTLPADDGEETYYESVEDETFEEIINSELEDASKENVVLGLFEFYLGNLEKSLVLVRDCVVAPKEPKCEKLNIQCKSSVAFVDSAEKTSSWIDNHTTKEASRSISSAGLKFSKSENAKLKLYRSKLDKYKNDVERYCQTK